MNISLYKYVHIINIIIKSEQNVNIYTWGSGLQKRVNRKNSKSL